MASRHWTETDPLRYTAVRPVRGQGTNAPWDVTDQLLASQFESDRRQEFSDPEVQGYK